MSKPLPNFLISAPGGMILLTGDEASALFFSLGEHLFPVTNIVSVETRNVKSKKKKGNKSK